MLLVSHLRNSSLNLRSQRFCPIFFSKFNSFGLYIQVFVPFSFFAYGCLIISASFVEETDTSNDTDKSQVEESRHKMLYSA